MGISLPIRTGRLLLRPFTVRDADQWYDARRDPEIHRYLYTLPEDREQAWAAVAHRSASTSLEHDSDVLALAVEPLSQPGLLVGDVHLHRLPHHGAEIGFVLHPEHHGHGYGTECARELLRIAFVDAGLHRVTARLDARNRASARALEKAGMRREAHFVRNEFVKGEWTDEFVYALLADEWR